MSKKEISTSHDINWYSPVLGCLDGYGASAEQMILAYERVTGGKVFLEGPSLMSGPTYIQDIINRPQAQLACRVAYTPPMRQSDQTQESPWKRKYIGQAVIGFTMWEDTIIPPIWEEPIRNADVVAVPSKASLKAMVEFCESMKIHQSIVYVPLGVNPGLYRPRHRTRKPGEVFQVVWLANTLHEERKGGDLAYKAFKAAFGDRTDVRLVLKAANEFLPTYQGFVPQWGHDIYREPNVSVLMGAMDDATKAQLLDQSQVLLYPSRGEGFGLIPLEAAASGLPSILTSGTAAEDYAKDLAGMVLVDSVPSRSQIWTSWQHQTRGAWREPRFEDLVKALKAAEEQYETLAKNAMDDIPKIQRNWTYLQSAGKLQSVVHYAQVERRGKMERLLAQAA